MMQPRHSHSFSSSAPTARLELHIKLIFLRGAACKVGRPSAVAPPAVGLGGRF